MARRLFKRRFIIDSLLCYVYICYQWFYIVVNENGFPRFQVLSRKIVPGVTLLAAKFAPLYIGTILVAKSVPTLQKVKKKKIDFLATCMHVENVDIDKLHQTDYAIGASNELSNSSYHAHAHVYTYHLLACMASSKLVTFWQPICTDSLFMQQLHA